MKEHYKIFGLISYGLAVCVGSSFLLYNCFNLAKQNERKLNETISLVKKVQKISSEQDKNPNTWSLNEQKNLLSNFNLPSWHLTQNDKLSILSYTDKAKFFLNYEPPITITGQDFWGPTKAKIPAKGKLLGEVSAKKLKEYINSHNRKL